MKRSWIPAALMGTLVLGYLAGQAGRGSPDIGAPSYVPPPASTMAPPPAHAVEPPPPTQPPPLPVEPPPTQPPPIPVDQPQTEPPPIPVPAPDRGLGEYPAWNGIDLDCGDVGHPVRVTGPDPHRLDRDGDGIGCEGYR